MQHVLVVLPVYISVYTCIAACISLCIDAPICFHVRSLH